jgi:hypothetical protein
MRGEYMRITISIPPSALEEVIHVLEEANISIRFGLLACSVHLHREDDWLVASVALPLGAKSTIKFCPQVENGKILPHNLDISGPLSLWPIRSQIIKSLEETTKNVSVVIESEKIHIVWIKKP